MAAQWGDGAELEDMPDEIASFSAGCTSYLDHPSTCPPSDYQYLFHPSALNSVTRTDASRSTHTPFGYGPGSIFPPDPSALDGVAHMDPYRPSRSDTVQYPNPPIPPTAPQPHYTRHHYVITPGTSSMPSFQGLKQNVLYRRDPLQLGYGEQLPANNVTSSNEYVGERVEQLSMPLRPGETIHGGMHNLDVHNPGINVRSEKQKPICKARCGCLPTSRTETPMSLAVSVASSTRIQPSVITAYKKELRECACQYAILEKPIWSGNESKYIDDLVVCLAKAHFPKEADAWLLENLVNMNESVKRTLQSVTDSFKQTACALVQEIYGLRIPINQSLEEFSATRETCINELLQHWNYCDEQMLLSMGELSHGIFNHYAITAIIQDAVWPQSDKFSKLIPEGTNNIDCLLAFTATIVRWALKALRRGPESDFEVAIYGPHYEAAMGRITDIRSLDPSDARLECLNTITSQLLQCGKHLVEFHQVVLD